jgi:hypothetical protein
MASDMSTYLGNALCRWLAGNAMPSAPATCYVALFNGNPKTTGIEVTTTVHATGRVAIAFDAIVVGTDNNLTNASDADFGTSAGNVAVLDCAAVFDAATGGNLLFSKVMPGAPYAVTAGSPVKFAAGNLTFTIGSAS